MLTPDQAPGRSRYGGQNRVRWKITDLPMLRLIVDIGVENEQGSIHCSVVRNVNVCPTVGTKPFERTGSRDPI